MLIFPSPIASLPAPKAPKTVLHAPSMRQPKAERRRNLLRYVLAGVHTSRTKAAKWVRRNGTAEIMSIAWRESEWGQTGAHFPHSHRSTAYGLFGLLDGTRRDLGLRKTSDPHAQIEHGLRYCDSRFGGDFSRALRFHKARRYW